MKIVHVIGDGRLSGAGLQLSYLATALSREFEIEVVAPPDAPILSRLRGEPLLTTALPFSLRAGICLSDIRRFEEYFLRTKPDIVHTHGNLAARVGAALSGVRHSLSTRHGFPTGVAHRRCLRTKLYNAVTALTVTTAYIGGNYLLAEGIPRERVVTIPSGVPQVTKKEDTAYREFRHALKIPEDARIIGSFAQESRGGADGTGFRRMSGMSGQGTLLRAFARVAAQCNDIFLILIGGSGEDKELLRLTSLLGIGERVRILPQGTDLSLCAGVTTLHVDPSSGSENSVLAACSLMSVGIPTVAADTAGMREVIDEGQNGRLFPSDNAYALAEVLLSLLSSEEQRRRLSHGALARYAENFSVPRMERAYADLYRRVVAS